MYTPETTDSPQLQFVRSFIQGYEMRDPNHLAKHWHKDLRRITYPRSLGLPEENREEWLQRITELISLWISFEVSYIRVVARSFPITPTENLPFHHRGSGKGHRSRSYPNVQTNTAEVNVAFIP